MKHEDHLKLDLAILGKEYPEVHRWLDGCYPDYLPGGRHFNAGSLLYHWSERHHDEALVERFGSGPELESARLHVVVDWISHLKCVELPKTREEVVRLLDAKLHVR